MLNIGDKLYCINTLTYCGREFFIKDRIYNIADKEYDRISVIDELGTSNASFSLRINNVDVYKFKNYFIDLKTYRKQKLNRLKNINEKR